ncbi:MAG TPA: pyridoxal phosphate-dependent aminotransferase, partial [bacterium]|nr:pyridoxal phosphate-dependent aminotransferase [bacterium]
GKGVLYHIFLSLLDPSDEVVIITPYWVSYPEQVRLCGGVPVFVQCDPHTFAIDSEDLKAKVSAKTRIILINSPSNPCGVVYTEEQLRLVADLAQQHNSYILSDEVYEHFYYGEKPRSIASLHEDAYARTIIVNAVSKTYAMTGWRIGFVAAADKEVIAAYSRLQDHTQSNPCSIAQWAAVEAYTGSQDSVTVMRDAFRKRRDSMVQLLNAIPGLHCATPEGAFYCFPRYELAMPSLQLAEQLLEEAHVVVMPGEPFGLEGYLRLSYAVADEHIPAGIERLHAWFAAHPVI